MLIRGNQRQSDANQSQSDANQSQSDGHRRCGLAQQRVAQEDEESRRRGHLLADALELLGHHCEQRVNNVNNV